MFVHLFVVFSKREQLIFNQPVINFQHGALFKNFIRSHMDQQLLNTQQARKGNFLLLF